MVLKFNLYDEVVDSSCRKFFPHGKVILKMIYDIVLKFDEDVGGIEDFCRLYLLLGIFEFLFPNRNGTVFPIIFRIVDDLHNIGKYNWGGLVYEYLVGSLCNGSMSLKNEGSTSHFHVDECVYLLQVKFLFV